MPQNQFALTPRLSDHARLRCIQMEVSTKRVKHIVQQPSMVVPGPPSNPNSFVATADYDPELRVPYGFEEDGRPLIITVLWNTQEDYVRPDAKQVTA